MLQRDRLAELLRGSDLAKTSLQLALKSKEEQRKGLAQNAQVSLPHANPASNPALVLLTDRLATEVGAFN